MKQNVNQSNGAGRPQRGERKRRAPQRQRRQRPSPGMDFKSLNPLSGGVAAPVAVSRQRRTMKPKMVTRANGDCFISHREYISDIVAAAGTPSVYGVQALPINPGQVSTFQWLSRVAANYESYKFSKLKFDYSTSAPSSLGGTLVLSVDYDASDPAPVNKQQAMAYRSSVRSAPWAPCQHISLAEDLSKGKTNFVRPGPQPAGTDIKTYDIGNLFIISQGVSTSSAELGELWVEYDVLLMTPVFENGALVVSSGEFVGGGVMSAVNPYGAAPVADAANVNITLNGASRISFPLPGNYYISSIFTGTGLAGFNVVTSPAGVIYNADYNLALASGVNMASTGYVAVSAPGYIDVTLTATTVTASELTIAYLAPGLA